MPLPDSMVPKVIPALSHHSDRNMTNGNSFGGTTQYGSPSAWFFGTLEGPIMQNIRC